MLSPPSTLYPETLHNHCSVTFLDHRPVVCTGYPIPCILCSTPCTPYVTSLISSIAGKPDSTPGETTPVLEKNLEPLLGKPGTTSGEDLKPLFGKTWQPPGSPADKPGSTPLLVSLSPLKGERGTPTGKTWHHYRENLAPLLVSLAPPLVSMSPFWEPCITTGPNLAPLLNEPGSTQGGPGFPTGENLAPLQGEPGITTEMPCTAT